MTHVILRLSAAHIEHDSARAKCSAPALTGSSFIMALALAFLCCLHTVLIVLWARHSLRHHYFSLSRLGTVAQAIAIVSQICTVSALSLLLYGLQKIAADKFIRQGVLMFGMLNSS